MAQEAAGNAVDIIDLGGDMPDFTMWGMFAQADWVVQLVMLVLLGSSLWCWAIIVDKSKNIRRIITQADKFDAEFWSGNSLEDLYERVKKNPDHPMAALFVAAMREWQRSVTGRGTGKLGMGLQDRIYRVMRVTVSREMERLENYLSFLATVGSTAPFIGLFGTVWGIMNAFKQIALTHDSSLSVVAPGIAEALFATAMGLVAAVPAVVAYNKFSNELGRYANRLEGFADEFGTILSRQLDEEHH